MTDVIGTVEVSEEKYPAVDVEVASGVLLDAARALRVSVHPASGQYIAPGLFTAEVASRVADWFEAEAALLVGVVPFVSQVSLAIEQASGGAAAIRLGVDEDGRLRMGMDSSLQAVAVAESVLARAGELGVGGLVR